MKQKVLDLQAQLIHLKKEHEVNKKAPISLPHLQPPSPPAKVKKDSVVVEISAASVAKSTLVVLLLLLLFYVLYQISNILVLLFVSFLFAAALDPIVGYFQQKKIPRSISVLAIYLLIFFGVGVLLAKLIPIIAVQAVDIAHNVGEFVQHLSSNGNSSLPFSQQLQPYLQQLYQAVDLSAAAGQIQNALQAVAAQLLNISVGFLNVIMVLVLTFFMTVEEKALEQFYLSLFPSRYGEYISSRLEAIKEKIGYWLRGQILVSFISTILTYIGLIILNVDYALTLSVIAGVFMLIPGIGRILALLLTLPIVYNQSPTLALWVTVYYIVLQQIELNVIIPYIMNRAVGLSPIIIIFATMVGFQYLGILGLIISIPIATAAAIFVKDYLERVK